MSLFITIILLLLFLPSINQSGFANSSITSKTVFFIYTLLVILSFYLFNIVFNKSKILSLKTSKIDISVSAIFIFIIVNRYILQSNYGFSIRFIELLGLGLLYVTLRNMPSKSFIWLLFAILVSGIVQAIYGNLQLLGYYPSNHSGFKITGSFFNLGPYAGFLTAVWPIALGMYLFKDSILGHVQTKSRSKVIDRITLALFEYIPLLGIICIALVTPATHSRSSWLGILLSSIVLIEYRYHVLNVLLKNSNGLKKAF